MFEERAEIQLAEQFERLLTLSVLENEAPGDLRADLRLAARLRDLNLVAESHIQSRLRAQLIQKMQRTDILQSRVLSHQAHCPYPSARPRVWISVMIAVLLLLILISNTPVRAALGRLFNYGFLPYAGFVPLSDTRVILGPVTQSTQNWSLTILQGIEDPQRTVLWIETNLDSTTFSTAELNLPDGNRLPIRAITPNQDVIVLVFDSLPEQGNRIELVLPSGWQLPVEWIAASQAGLAPTQVSVPFQTQTPAGSQNQSPCVDLEREIQICVQAAFSDSAGTHLLLQAFQFGQPVPLDWNPAEWQSIELRDEAGRNYPIRRFETVPSQDSSMVSIRFTDVPSNVNVVTLHLPSQIFTLLNSGLQQNQAIDLLLRLPDRVPTRSSTPGAVLPAPDHLIVIPTPGIH